MEKAGVLVCDDNPVFGESFCELFRRRGWRSDYAANAAGALARAAVHPYAAFVIDQCLGGGMSGLELLAALRLRPQYARTPAVLLTASAARDHDALCAGLIGLGPASLVPKPAGADAVAAELVRLRDEGGAP